MTIHADGRDLNMYCMSSAIQPPSISLTKAADFVFGVGQFNLQCLHNQLK